MPTSTLLDGRSFQNIRQELDQQGFYQPLVPESLPLVGALLDALKLSKSDLKACRDQIKRRSAPVERKESSAAKPFESNVGAREEANKSKIESLERKLFDLELLNTHATQIITRLQAESMEKSRKILRLESGMDKAKVVTKSPSMLKPKIEMTSLVKPAAVRGVPKQSRSSKLDLLAIYEKKNARLDEELSHLQRKLSEAQKMMANLNRDLEKGPEPCSPEGPIDDSQKSAYMLKLIRENERLKDKLSLLDRNERIVLRSHGGRQGNDGRKQLSRSCSFEDIRSAVEKSHMLMHNKCLRNQVSHLQAHASSHEDIHDVHMERQTNREHIADLESNLKKLTEENRQLKRRVNELSDIRDRQDSKVRDLEQQTAILLRRSGSSEIDKVEELIGYIEKQRDMYKRSVHKLLDKLEPDRRRLEETLLNDSSDGHDMRGKPYLKEKYKQSPEMQALTDILDNSRRIVRGQSRWMEDETRLSKDKSYTPTQYRNASSVSDADSRVVEPLREEVSALKGRLQALQNEARENEKKLNQDIASLRSINETLQREIEFWKQKNSETEQKLQDKESNGRDEMDSSVFGLRQRCHEQEQRITDLQSQISDMHVQLRSHTQAREELEATVEERDKALLEADRRVDELTSKMRMTENDKLVTDQQLHHCLQELERLKLSLQESDSQVQNLRDRKAAEKSVSVELRIENKRLADELQAKEARLNEHESEIRELKGHVQRYVNEVKRIEELFAVRERERNELLQQYKQLSVEVDTAESYGRKMEAQVSSLQMQLSTKEAELEASQRRLSDMEKDLIDLSLSNETYRAQVATLSTKVDVASSQLREARSQTTWMNTDLSDVHELADQLNAQKVELQGQIADQNEEINHLNDEILHLRQEVSELSEQIRQERVKSRELEDRLRHFDRKASPAGR